MATKQPNALLKKAREAKGYTQKYVAKMVDVRESTYQNWEAGQTFPYPDHRRLLCDLFKASMEELGLLPGHEDASSCIMELKDASANTREISDFLAGNLGSRLRSIVDAATYADQRKALTLILEQFDAMNTDNPNYQITRREALASLATFPFVPPLNLQKRSRVPTSHYELFLQECGASLAACEELRHSSEAADLVLAFGCVSRYLGELLIICHSSSSYRTQALELAARCAILKTNLGWDCAGDAAALVFAQDAMTFARESGNISLQLSAYSKLAWAYLYDDKKKLALVTARDARELLEKHKNPLPICIRGGTYSTLSVMQARNRLSPDMAIKKASEQGPDHEVRYLMEFTGVQMLVEQGTALCYAGEIEKALDTFAQLIDPKTLEATKPFQGLLTENWRIQTILEMSRVSIQGKARNMKEAIRYWKAAIEGAKKLKSEGGYSGALATYDDMEIAFPDEQEVHELRDYDKHW